MYIMKCDRCGKEQEMKSILPIFGKDDQLDRRKYTIMSEFREITLCPECEEALDTWITRRGCYNCKHNETRAELEPCASCDTKSKNHWEAK